VAYLGSCYVDVHSHFQTTHHQRVDDVITISDPRHLQSFQSSKMLLGEPSFKLRQSIGDCRFYLESHEIGQCLQGVISIGQSAHNRYGGLCRQFI
jgi:hypothetical protein